MYIIRFVLWKELSGSGERYDRLEKGQTGVRKTNWFRKK
jgi:hypothetical protein